MEGQYLNNYKKQPFVPAIQKTSTLVILSIISLIGFIISINSITVNISPSYNKKVEARARAQKGAMLGGALKIGGGLLMGNPAMALGGASSFLQEGGYIKNYNHGGQVEDPENPKPVGNGMSDDDAMATSMLGMAMGGMTKGKYSPLPGDTVDAKLEPGEYVLNRNAVNAIGKENLDEVNNEKAPRFDKGKVKMRMGGYLYGG